MFEDLFKELEEATKETNSQYESMCSERDRVFDSIKERHKELDEALESLKSVQEELKPIVDDKCDHDYNDNRYSETLKSLEETSRALDELLAELEA